MKILQKQFIPYYSIGVIILVFLIFKYVHFSEDRGFSEVQPGTALARSESCMQCHDLKLGFSAYHNPENIGCTGCHLGDPDQKGREMAHKDMILIPGNLSDVAKTCGKCHTEEHKKISKSLMTTNSGIIAVDKFIFGEADSPDYHYHIKDLKYSKTDQHLRSLCANCHLGAEKNEYGKITQLSRGGGCTACHLNYSDAADKDLKNYLSSDKKKLPTIHPSTDIFVSDKHCYGCHSRSSRISTNYQGWQETLFEIEDIQGKEGFMESEDGRIYQFRGEDVHHAKGMLCIDCHSSHEVMGDGKDHLHEEKAVTLQCTDCHFKDQPKTLAYDELDTESSLVFLHRNYTHQNKRMLKVQKDGHPLVNTFVDEKGDVFLIGKGDQQLHPVKKQSEVCSRDQAHQSLACSTCHSQWTTRCIGCHNSFEKNSAMAYDLLSKEKVKDHWVEAVFEFGAARPALGVRENSEERRIEPAVPGMIMSIDHESFDRNATDKITFHRLYAPNSPHTTTKAVRNCSSCHSDPAALGYGNGKLIYSVKSGVGEWIFKPEYAPNKHDGLPEDAWIPFKGSRKNEVVSTRTDFRPFSVAEQNRILLVGACLQCHKDNSSVMKQTLAEGLGPVILRKSKNCILPKK